MFWGRCVMCIRQLGYPSIGIWVNISDSGLPWNDVVVWVVEKGVYVHGWRADPKALLSYMCWCPTPSAIGTTENVAKCASTGVCRNGGLDRLFPPSPIPSPCSYRDGRAIEVTWFWFLILSSKDHGSDWVQGINTVTWVNIKAISRKKFNRVMKRSTKEHGELGQSKD